MTFDGWIQIALFCVVITLLVKPLGGYMTRVFAGERTFLSPVLGPVERGLYRLSGVDERAEQNWLTYAVSMLLFSLAGFLSLYALMRFQALLPFNPAGQSAVEESLAFNTAMSFTTNTNWQSYVPRSDDELPRADGGAHGAQLRLGGDRHCACHRAGARLRPPLGPRHRQLLGRSGALHALRPAAALDRRRPVLRLAGHAAESRRLHRGDDAGRRQAGDRPGPGRLAGSHQDAGHQRRRLLQHQLRPSVREPQRRSPTSCRSC